MRFGQGIGVRLTVVSFSIFCFVFITCAYSVTRYCLLLFVISRRSIMHTVG